jgi:hypothetical protein
MRRKGYYYLSDLEGFEQRCRQRLETELGLDAEGIEVILHMRRQIMALQASIRELEAELDSHRQAHSARLSGYQSLFYEATWVELDNPDLE